MKTLSRRALASVLIGAASLAGAVASHAAYPEKPIRLVVPFPPGGGVDVLARLLGEKLSTMWGQPVVIDNKPGADTQIGTAAVAQSPPDGYTIGLLTSAFSINKALYPNLSYDAARDFTPITGIAQSPFYLVAWPGLDAKDVPSLIALAKKKPGALNYSSSGSDGFLAGELMKKAAGIDVVHVRYKGTPPSVMAVMSGEISYSFFTLLGIKAHVDAGKLRVLGVSTATRSKDMPSVPPLAEVGVPGYDMAVWFGVLGPRDLPPEITARLNDALQKILAMPDVRQKIESLGASPMKQTPAQFRDFLEAEYGKFGAVVRENKLRPE
ncbi:tripartite tricarboxylate transporter substrate binding protein [Xenophilus azovorans]|uniref:Bug family tripartite tricarboxylate transporter substrate binding protein n=1 Tax=Xenophilus TaxID=151754 RepID=UPI00057106B7|nr:tripartite tricarboxylate transporter substrate binding protein [Xenophilus azovorans]